MMLAMWEPLSKQLLPFEFTEQKHHYNSYIIQFPFQSTLCFGLSSAKDIVLPFKWLAVVSEDCIFIFTR